LICGKQHYQRSEKKRSISVTRRASTEIKKSLVVGPRKSREAGRNPAQTATLKMTDMGVRDEALEEKKESVELPQDNQARVLRVLQEKKKRLRKGGSENGGE